MAISANEIQQTLIKTIKKAAAQSVLQAEYDKTVLATVQFCTNVSTGQYKIKYQNGYFTAYAQNTDVKYSNGATVYVTVPKNNLNNRLLITGLATNDANAKTYITNYEGDQQYGIDGTNLVYQKDRNEGAEPLVIGLSTYNSMGDDPPYELPPIFDRNNLGDALVDITRGLDGDGTAKGERTADEAISEGGGYIRFGATFRTDIPDDQRYGGGNYGLVLKLRFFENETEKEKWLKGKTAKTIIKEYTLDTMNMDGTPFDFYIATKQYAYFAIEKDTFYRIEGIYPFVRGFNRLDLPDPIPNNIFISDITLYNAYMLYDSNNNKYKGEIVCDDGFTFEATNTNEVRSKTFTARLRVDGNIVENPKEQKVKFYWAIEDSTINEKNRKRYNTYTGAGWRCINTVEVKEYDSTQSETPLDEQVYIIDDEGDLTHVKYHTWKADSDVVTLKETAFPGKKMKLKCVIVYNNVPIEIVKTITNENGIYLVFDSSNGTEFYGGAGSTNLTVGAFKDVKGEHVGEYTLANMTLVTENPLSYKWSITDITGKTTDIPPTNPQELIFESSEAWVAEHSGYDDESVAQEDVDEWLRGKPATYARCIERYNYYSSKYYLYKDSDTTKANRSKSRMTAIVSAVTTLVKSMYAENVENTSAFIFGPSNVAAQYEGSVIDRNTNITSTTPYYYGTSEYTNYENFQNTLMYLTGSMVGIRSTITVTAIRGGKAVASESITLKRAEATNLDYTVEIVNGTQTFMYNTGGISPASRKVPSPIKIKPLYFKLYNKEGTVIYNSEEPDSEENKTDVTTLQPKWIFRDASDSLIQTTYVGTTECRSNPKDANEMWLSMADAFHYTIAEKFNRQLVDSSNVTIELHYDDQVIRGVSNLMFAKQGELGTNGTDSYLDIEDVVYERFKNDVLTQCTGSKIREKVNGVWTTRTYTPAERHLKNTYMYATKSYSSPDQGGEGVMSDNFVNLKFAGTAITGDYTDVSQFDLVGGESTANLYGVWYDKGVSSDITAESKWSTVTAKGYKYINPDLDDPNTSQNRILVSGKPPFKLTVPGTDPGSSTYAVVAMDKAGTNPDRMYRPSPIDHYPIDEGEGFHASTNTVALEGVPSSAETQNLWHGYAYYPMPYFYYHSTRRNDAWMDNLNPASRIVVVGGFDQVIYDSSGLNPEYDKQNPFKVFLFDEVGNNITETAIKNGTVSWTCSSSLQKTKTNIPSTFPLYDNIEDNVDLYDKYVRYQNKYYHCIFSHTKATTPLAVPEHPEEGHVIFERSYWEEVDPILERKQTFNVTPPAKYDSVAKTDLFSSWVRVTITYTVNGGTIEAEAYIPINVICNKYGSDEINGWDGKKSKVEDTYIITSKVAAGKKYSDNSFCGITIGENFYQEKDRKNEVGLFGYGRTSKNDPNSWSRTVFIDAESGRMILGPSGGSQIILNPKISNNNSQAWSRLNGWYISTDFFYKPVGEGIENLNSKSSRLENFTKYSQGTDPVPDDSAQQGSVGMYCPRNRTVEADTVFLWASSKNKDLGDETIGPDLIRYKAQVAAYGVEFNGYVMIQSSVDSIREDFIDTIDAKKTRIRKINEWIEIIQNTPSGETPTVPVHGQAGGGPNYVDPDADIYETTDIPTLVGMRSTTQQELTEEENTYNSFSQAVDNYESTYSRYEQLKEAETGGTPTTFRTFDNKKSNFYVTYGGHLHAASADIEGHIVANSGRFGNGSNKIEIAITKNNKKYILYNKNFWVEDVQGEHGENATVGVKGHIMAMSGQFGKVGDTLDGYEPGTLFIEYSWFPWRLPSDSEKWVDGTTFYLNTAQGRTQKYALYNKNFYVTNSGEPFFNGKLYTRSGRIGNWVIKDDCIKSVPYTARYNNTDYQCQIILDDDKIKVGDVTIYGYGRLTGPQWYIEPDGSASFSKVKYLANSTGGTIISSDGNLEIPAGKCMKIGGGELRAWQSGSGFSFEGQKVYFEDEVNLGKNINLNSGASITFTEGGSSKISISGTKIQFGSYSIDNEGNTNFKNLKIGNTQIIDSSGTMTIGANNINIGNQSLENYIKSVIDSKVNGAYIRNALGTVTGYTTSTSGAEPHSHSVAIN